MARRGHKQHQRAMVDLSRHQGRICDGRSSTGSKMRHSVSRHLGGHRVRGDCWSSARARTYTSVMSGSSPAVSQYGRVMRRRVDGEVLRGGDRWRRDRGERYQQRRGAHRCCRARGRRTRSPHMAWERGWGGGEWLEDIGAELLGCLALTGREGSGGAAGS
uniref:Uncharacterized protein n=1 Tax=Arundo donax TaxID=35708 RepID=A0A0A9CDT4_ARUDO